MDYKKMLKNVKDYQNDGDEIRSEINNNNG